LLLAPEMSMLNRIKPKISLGYLNQLLFEIVEAVDRPELTKKQQQQILSKFTHRFALKLQGEVVEGKWNRKLVGLKEEKNLLEYLTINMQKTLSWGRKEIIPKNPQFHYKKLSIDDSLKYELFKFRLNQTAINKLSRNVFQLGANLLQIANAGTTSDIEINLLTEFLNIFSQTLFYQYESLTIETFNKSLDLFLPTLQNYFKKFIEFSNNFVHSVRTNTLSILIQIFQSEISTFTDESDILQKDFLTDMGKIVKNHLITEKYRYDFEEKIRVNEIGTPLHYIIESGKNVLKSIKKALPQYYKHVYMDDMRQKMKDLMVDEFFHTKNQALSILGLDIVEKFNAFMQDQIEEYIINETSISGTSTFDQFKELAKKNIDPFIQQLKIKVEDVLIFCKHDLPEVPLFLNAIEELSTFPKDIEIIWSMILRNSFFQKFLQDYPDDKIFDPREMSKDFIRFLQKRLGGFHSKWKKVIFNYIQDYSNIYYPQYFEDRGNKIFWSKNKIVSLFIEYLENRVKEETTLEGFIIPMKIYLEKIAMKNVRLHQILEISKKYIEGLEVLQQIPTYLQQVFDKILESIKPMEIEHPIFTYLGSNETIDIVLQKTNDFLEESFINKPNFYNFVLDRELHYFSKLITSPKEVVLQSHDRKNFPTSSLVQNIYFNYNIGEKYFKTSISTNLLQIKKIF
ncbi:MAG: hypothetical protein ACTSWL_08855, partial [Promethearchaeota archaeon]